MKNDALKKHHFWILFGLSFLFVALALVFLMTKVSTAIASGQKENDDQVAKVKSTNPPGKGVLDRLDEQKGMLDKMKDKLWEKNWTLQEKFFTWPNHPQNLFKRFEKIKFGTDIDQTYSDFEHEQMKLRSVYQAAYEETASRITPTQFGRGSWQNVLRWVSAWGDRKAQSKQMWLVMEDLWVQRALLDPISVVNKQIATFTPVPGPDSKPLKQTFQSRVWELQLEVLQGGPTGNQMKVLLKNRTPQLQILGKGNRMLVNVWLDERVQVPFVLPIEGAFIPGNSEYPAPERDAQGRERPADPLLVPITPGISITKLAKVELQQDIVSVPVRSLDQVVLGYSSDKQTQMMAKETKTLEPPKFWPDDAADATGAGGAPGMPGMGGPGAEGGGPPGMMGPGAGGPGSGDGMMGGGKLGGGMGGNSMGSSAMATATTLMGATNANRKRYLLINDQIRRMPVAFTLVCDQMYIQDVLIAYANSPLRFEAVQYHWRRMNRPTGSGGMGGAGMDDASGGGDMVGGFAANGLTGSFGGPKGGMGMGMGGPGMGGPGMGGPGAMPGGAGPGSSGMPGMGGPGAMPGGAGPGSSGMPGMGGPGAMPGGSDMGMGMGGFGGFGSGFGGFGGSLFSTISDAQSNAGLVELTVYGIISIYEKYEVKPEGGEAPAPEGAPAAPAAGAPAAGAPANPDAPAAGGLAPAPGTAPVNPAAPAAGTPAAPGTQAPGTAPAAPGAGAPAPAAGTPAAPGTPAPGTTPAAPGTPAPAGAPGKQ